MKKVGLVFLLILFINVTSAMPSIDFIGQTPADGTLRDNDNFIINVSTYETGNHYTFVDFDNSLKGWFRMDSVNSTHIFDESKYALNGTLNGTGLTINSTGSWGNASWFNGTSTNYIDLGISPATSIIGNSITVSAWLYVASNTRMCAVCRGGVYSQANESYAVYWDTFGEGFKYSIRNISGSIVTLNYNPGMSQFHHVVAVYNGTTALLYVDGTQRDSDTGISGNLNPITVSAANRTFIGASASNTAGGNPATSYKWNGSIDEVLIFNRSLSPQEVFALYNATTNQYYHNFTSLSVGGRIFKGYAVNGTGFVNYTSERTVYLTGLNGGADSISPSVNLFAPLQSSSTNLDRTSFNASFVDNVHLSNITLYVWNSTGIVNQTAYIKTGPTNFSNVTFVFPYNGTFIWNYFVFDNSSNSAWATTNFTVNYSYNYNSSIILASSCTQTDVQSAIALASFGGEVSVPAGNCVWSSLNLNKTITLSGSGTSLTNITVGSSTPILISTNNSVVRNFRMTTNASSSTSASFFNAAAYIGWRVTGMFFDQNNYSIRYLFDQQLPPRGTNDTYGLVDSNQFWNISGEQLTLRGPCDSWNSNSSFGQAGALFLENNTFFVIPGGTGYLTANANARIVARYNTLRGIYFDQHGLASNSDGCGSQGGETHASARSIEAYNNIFINTSYMSVYIRGGTGLVYNNKIYGAHSGSTAGQIWMHEYIITATAGVWNDSIGMYYPQGYVCADDYPIMFQIGRGVNQTSEPVYIWNNTYADDGSTVGHGFGFSGGAAHTTVRGNCSDPSFQVSDVVVEDRDFCLHDTSTTCNGVDVEYSSYACPHPLTGLSGSCNSSEAGSEGYLIGTSEEEADITDPAVTLLAPINGTNTSVATTSFNATMTDNVNLSNATLYVWNSTGIVNQTTYVKIGTSNFTNTTFSFPRNGSYIWNYFVVDNSSNSAWATANFTINYTVTSPDTTNPGVTIISPTATTYTSDTLTVNVQTDEVAVCSYTLSEGTTNYSLTANSSNTGFTALSPTLSNAAYTLRAYCNDSSNNFNSTEIVNFTVSVSSSSGSSGSSGGGGGGGGGGGASTTTTNTNANTSSTSSSGSSSNGNGSENTDEEGTVEFGETGNNNGILSRLRNISTKSLISIIVIASVLLVVVGLVLHRRIVRNVRVNRAIHKIHNMHLRTHKV